MPWLRSLCVLFFGGLGLLLPPAAFGETDAPCPQCNGQGIVFVANGSGDSDAVTEGLKLALWKTGIPLCVDTVRWSRYDQASKDHTDVEGHLLAAADMAARVTAYRKACPKGKIYLMAHSAGSHVVLATAEQLPPDTVDRIILLAPSVSFCYDLRAALKASREGIDSYSSCEDQVVVIAADYYGTADGLCTRTAGEVGFAPLQPSDPDASLYRNLRQYWWTSRVSWTGHFGGHIGATKAKFVAAYVLPIMLYNECVVVENKSDKKS
jgi:pimeloyl-ACP methyl ester carboxylesterase